MKTALLFPGQGSQYVGMGRSLSEAFPDVRRLYQAATDLLGYDVERVCFEGPKERLSTTLYTQPILFVVCVAVFRIFEKVLKGLCRRIDPKIRCDAAETLEELKRLPRSAETAGNE